MDKTKNFTMNISPHFREKCKAAIESMSPDQDEAKIPDSGGQILIRANSPAAKKREELIREASCFPLEHDGKKYLVCAQ